MTSSAHLTRGQHPKSTAGAPSPYHYYNYHRFLEANVIVR